MRFLPAAPWKAHSWAPTASVSWHNFHQGYKRHWGCDYAYAIRAANLPTCASIAREHLDEQCIREESNTLAVRLTSYSQAQDVADALLAALAVAVKAEEGRHTDTEAGLARPESYVLETSIRVATTDSAHPTDYACGENVCLYYDGTSNLYGGSEREEPDLMRTIARTFARAVLADVGPLDVEGLPDSAYEDAKNYGLN